MNSRVAAACLVAVGSLASAVACGGSNDSPPFVDNTNGDSGEPESGDDASVTHVVTRADAASDATDAEPSDAGVDAAPVDADNGSAPWPATHAAVPQVVNSGGTVLAAPHVIPIFFADDPYQAKIEQFLQALAASSYWPAATHEYGVGTLSIGASIVIPGTPPSTLKDADIQVLLANHLASSGTSWPPVAANNIYLLYTSGSSAVSDSAGAACVAFGGYHYEANVDQAADAGANAPSTPFVYGVIPRCASFGSLNGIDVVTEVSSHEIVEAATDPFPVTAPAYAQTNDDSFIWTNGPGGEVGDMCAYETQSDQRIVGDFVVQRIWSNARATAGEDPCAPPLDAGAPYFNAAPDLSDTVTVSYYGESVRSKGLHLAIGQSATLTIRFFSSAPTDQWKVEAEDMSTAFDGPAELTFSPSSVSGNNGDVRTMTVTAVASDTSAAMSGGAEFFLYSYRAGSEDFGNYWFGFVEN